MNLNLHIMGKNNLIRYSSAAGALLAISGNTHAVIKPGLISGDALLNNLGDRVFIDFDKDGIDDFIGAAVGVTYYNGPKYIGFILAGYQYGNLIELDSYSSYIIKKFNLNDMIGPLSYPYYYGYISTYTEGVPINPPAAPFDPTNDEGYIGISKVTSSGINYGWIQVAISHDGKEVEFISCAMEHTDNTPILAGNSIPVPLLPIASAAGLGLIGLMAALKKRRKVTV